jgi:hypothetical protein
LTGRTKTEKESESVVGIFVHQSLQYAPIGLEEFCIDQITEVCVIKFYHSTNNICILTVYRVPTGNLLHFLNSLEVILNRIHTRSIRIILCGDININYLDDTGNNKPRLNSLLASCHLSSIVDFPTRVSSTSATTIDNIFINRNTNETFSITSLPNGLSDHDAQLLILSNTSFLNSSSSSVTRRLINEHTIIEFKKSLSCEYNNLIQTMI